MMGMNIGRCAIALNGTCMPESHGTSGLWLAEQATATHPEAEFCLKAQLPSRFHNACNAPQHAIQACCMQVRHGHGSFLMRPATSRLSSRIA